MMVGCLEGSRDELCFGNGDVLPPASWGSVSNKPHSFLFVIFPQ